MASIARHHAEWLSLVEASGPFVSLPVLVDVFPQGLSGHDSDVAKRLRQAYELWDDGPQYSPSQRTWTRHVFIDVLGYKEEFLAEHQAIPATLKSELPEHGETLRPDVVLLNPDDKKPRVLIQVYPATQSLDSQLASGRWKASPETRMAQLLRDTGVRLGIVTNGEQWMLVNAPKNETTGFISWYANLWLEEPLTLQSFRDLLGAERLFGVSEEETLEKLLDRSLQDQHEVTDQLGFQVRKAVEVLVQAIDKADRDSSQKLLAGVAPETLYEAALTVMMRLVFLFCAEERGLLLLGDELYDRNYAVSTLREQLRFAADQHSEAVLEDRTDAWFRLLTTFRAVHGGVQHDRLRLPAYGGSLFDPDRFSFLEGRPKGTKWKEVSALPVPVNNRTVLHLLEALQLLQVRVPGGGPAEARKLSFRALDIEQIGHVYEGLLDHTARMATEPVLGIVGSGRNEPEVELSELEKHAAKGRDDLVKYLKDLTGKTPKSLKKLLDGEVDMMTASKFQTACQDKALWERVKPFANLVREDTLGYPVVVLPDSVYVTEGSDRRSTGTHYTPRSLTEPIVQYTLEPLVYVGPAEGKPKEEWKLKSAKELLQLRICDMACGSGAFLVQACRYMTDRLLEAWEKAEDAAKTKTARITPEGLASRGDSAEEIIPKDSAERRIYATRSLVKQSVYGVDKNPLAVEMAKLSLWLLTMAKNMPFEFLDHAVRCGDALVGIHDLQQLVQCSLEFEKERNSMFQGPLEKTLGTVVGIRSRILQRAARTVSDVESQAAAFGESSLLLSRLTSSADVLVGARYWEGAGQGKPSGLDRVAPHIARFVETGNPPETSAVAAAARQVLRMLHWPLEFPEVFARGGFDAFIGNPPFINAIDGDLTSQQKGWLGGQFRELRGTADFAYYFLARADQLLKPKLGRVGLVLPRVFLNAPAAKRLRARLNKSRPPAMIFCPRETGQFQAANVRIAAVSLGRSCGCLAGEDWPLQQTKVEGDNWWADAFSQVGAGKEASGPTLGEQFEVIGSMTTGMAYEVLPFLRDQEQGEGPKLVTTGLIDPEKCWWGEKPCKYLKHTFSHPRIDLKQQVPSSVLNRLKRVNRPKVLVAGVAGPGRRVEAFVDVDGSYCGAVSTYSVFDKKDDLSKLQRLCRALNDESTATLVVARLGAAAMGSGMLTITKKFLLELPCGKGAGHV